MPRRSRQCQATSQGFTAGLRLSSYAGVPFLASPVPVLDASHTLGLELPITSSDKDAAFHPAISNRKYQPLSCLGLARPDFCKLDVSRRALFRVKVGPVVSSPAAPRNDLLSATKIAMPRILFPTTSNPNPVTVPPLLASNEPLLRRSTYTSSRKAGGSSQPGYTQTSLFTRNFSIDSSVES